jgi:hypothetical protein
MLTPGTILFDNILRTVSFKLCFVMSCDNDANLFTKNVNKDIYKKHVSKFLGKIGEKLGVSIWERGRLLECIPHIFNPRYI